MLIIIDLVDHENVSHDSLMIELDASASMKELQNEVLSCFHIKMRYQQILKSDGQRIDLMTGSLRSVGIQDTDFVKTISQRHVRICGSSTLQVEKFPVSKRIWGSGKPYIVDFTIIGKPMTTVNDLYRDVRMSQKINEHLGTLNECFPVLLDYIEKSNFIATLDRSLETFLHNQKLFFDKSQLVFEKPQKTEDLIEYIENVKKNVKLLLDYSLVK